MFETRTEYNTMPKFFKISFYGDFLQVYFQNKAGLNSNNHWMLCQEY